MDDTFKNIGIPFGLFLNARNRMLLGRTSGEDAVTVDLLRALQWDALDVVWHAIHMRLNAMPGHTGDPDYWKSLVGIALFKDGKPGKLDNYRVIFFACLLKKWFLSVVVALTVELIPEMPYFVMGLRPGRQVLDVVASITLLLQRSDEWHLPMVVGTVDVRTAFDEVRHPSTHPPLHDGKWRTDATSMVSTERALNVKCCCNGRWSKVVARTTPKKHKARWHRRPISMAFNFQ